MFRKFAQAAAVLGVCFTLAGKVYVPGGKIPGDFEEVAVSFLESHCFDCHDDETSEAGLNLLDLGPVDQINAAVWKSVWAQIAMGEMPPKNKKRPDVIRRLEFSDWIVQQLQNEMKDKGGFKAHLDPKKANYLEHDLLFGDLPEGIK